MRLSRGEQHEEGGKDGYSTNRITSIIFIFLLLSFGLFLFCIYMKAKHTFAVLDVKYMAGDLALLREHVCCSMPPLELAHIGAMISSFIGTWIFFFFGVLDKAGIFTFFFFGTVSY